MDVAVAIVRSVETVANGLAALRLACPEIARQAGPGQFVMVRSGDGFDPYLPRPFSIAGVTPAGSEPDTIDLLVQPAGSGSRWLAARRPGDEIALTGPCGRVLTLERGTRHLLLIGQGSHLAPLLFLSGHALAAGTAITLIQLYGDDPVVPPERLPGEVEVILEPAANLGATRQGLTEHLRWADEIVVAGDEVLLQAGASVLKRAVIRKSARAIVRGSVPCGTGLCGACDVETRRHGSRPLCLEGPAFDLRDLY